MRELTQSQIGIDSFSYHRYFGEHTRWEQPLTTRWQTDDFLRRAAALGVAWVSLQTVYLPQPTSGGFEQFIQNLRDQLDTLGLHCVLAWGHRSGLEGGTNPQKVDEMLGWLDVAKRLGCPLMRVVGGDVTHFSVPAEERIERLVPILHEVCAAAGTLTIAIENHGDFALHDLARLIEQVAAPNLGMCFDPGNAVRIGDNLLQAVKLAAPLAKMVHIKDMIPQGALHGFPDLWGPAHPWDAESWI